MGLYRVSPPQQPASSPPDGGGGRPVDLDEWLDSCQNEYDALVARLRHLDAVLVRYKRKRHLLLPRRIK